MPKVEKKLDVFEFGRQLLEINDLDPTYVVLYNAGFSIPEYKQFLLAYWCFYHFGTASWIVDRPDYWGAMQVAANSKDYPRSSERRHYRGQQAVRSVGWLRSKGLDSLFKPLIGEELTANRVIEYVKTWHGFGDWIAFKVADMLERLELTQVHFDVQNIQLFDSPAKGAELMWVELGSSLEAVPKNLVPWAVGFITNEIEEAAPPAYDRPINVQEAETILCKWKSYMGGHYEIGEDIVHVKHGLLKFAKCKTAQRLITAGRKGGLWK